MDGSGDALVADALYPMRCNEPVRKCFREKELLDLTFAVLAINSWNRLAVSLRAVPAVNQPKTLSAAACRGTRSRIEWLLERARRRRVGIVKWTGERS